MHACVDLRDPRVSPFQGKPQVVVFNLGRVVVAMGPAPKFCCCVFSMAPGKG
jgi:hypothetical protein